MSTAGERILLAAGAVLPHVSPSTRSAAWRHRYGPWALVTGASDGIGRALAIELAGRGLNVVITARREGRLQALASELASSGTEIRLVAADLSTDLGCHRLIAACEPLEIGLVAASAGFGTSGAFLTSDLERERALLAVNCGAVLTLSWHFGRQLARRGRGGLLLMGSIVGFQGVPHAAHYAASKAYVQSLGEGLGPELRARGVDVVVAAPGPVMTGFAGVAGLHFETGLRPEQVAREALAALGSRLTVRPGLRSKALGWSLSMLPRPVRTRILGRVMADLMAPPADE